MNSDLMFKMVDDSAKTAVLKMPTIQALDIASGLIRYYLLYMRFEAAKELPPDDVRYRLEMIKDIFTDAGYSPKLKQVKQDSMDE